MRITKYEAAKARYASHSPECSLRLCSILITLGAQNTFIQNSHFAYYPRHRKRSRRILRSQTCWFVHAKLEPGQLSGYCCFHFSPSIALGLLRCQGFLGGASGKNLPANAGNKSSIPNLGRSHVLFATKPMCHKCWGLRALGPLCCSYQACMLPLLKLVHLESVFCNKKATAMRSPQTTMNTRCNQINKV